MTSNEKKYCNKSIKDVMRWGYGFTSINGVTQYRDTDSKISKVSWFVITIVGTLLTLFSVYGCFRSYFAYNTVTTVGITNEISTNFPSVTICNQNRIHCKHLYNLIRNCTKNGKTCDRKDVYCELFIMTHCIVSLKHVSRFESKTEVEFDPICIDGNASKYKAKIYNEENAEGCSNDSKLIIEGGPYHSKRITKNDFYNAYLKLSKEDVIAIAHQPEDMIKYCEFSGYPISSGCTELIKGTHKIFGPATGVCYSFNFRGMNRTIKSEVAVYGGQEFGLQLVLDVEEGYYMKNSITESIGARVVVEHSVKMPSLISNGKLVSPGTETNIGISRTHIKRLKKPYNSSCTDEYLNDRVKFFIGNITYSSTNCRGLCFLNKIFTQCGCLYPVLVEGYFIDIWFEKISKNSTTCRITQGSTDWHCINNLRNLDDLTIDEICSCYPECKEMKFNTQISSSFWPSGGVWPRIMEDYNITYKSKTFTEIDHLTHAINGPQCYNLSQYMGAGQDMENIRTKNFMKINVFYESLDKEDITENPQYPTLSDFMNTLGGALSLFIGASFIQIIELLEIILRLIYVSIY